MRHKLFLLMLALTACLALRAQNYPPNSDVLWLTIPDHADWLYRTGEQARVEVTLLKYGIPRDAEVTFETGPDMMPVASSGKVQLKNGRATISLGTLKTPGFLDCQLTATLDGHKYRHHVKVGFSPEKLKPYTRDPSDFDQFWQDVLQEARKTKVTASCQRSDKYSTDDVDCYLLKIRTDRRHSVYAYLTMPKGAADGAHPIVLCPPGAGIKTIKEPMRNHYYARNGFIRLEMEIHGINPELPEADFNDVRAAFSGENEYLNLGLDNRDLYYMKHVYAACVRCLDYLTTLPQWDGRNLIVQGGSQGGALSLITAALDHRVTACVANHPALSDMAGYLDNRAGGYPHFVRTPGMLTKEKVAVMAYYDVVNFARRIECPVYLTWGFNDNTCPPTTSYIVWNTITAPKESLITPINEHWTSADTNYGQMLWIKSHLK